MIRNIPRRASVPFALDLHLLKIDRNGDVRNAAIDQRGTASQFGDIFHVRRAHAARVIDADVGEQLVEFHVLLRMGLRQIVKLHPRDRQNRLAVQFRVVQSIQQMNAAGPGRRQAASQPARVLGIRARHKCRRFFMPHLDEAHLSLRFAERFHYIPLMPSPGNPKTHQHPRHELFPQEDRMRSWRMRSLPRLQSVRGLKSISSSTTTRIAKPSPPLG